jgi:beta-galactosidase/beta-glucuronidase
MPSATGPRDQPLYRVNITFTSALDGSKSTTSTTTAAERRLGFRTVALVTGNDTDPEYVKQAAGEEGADSHGMFYRVNGAAILARGGNMIPMDNMEGRFQAGAHAQLVVSAAEANMNM